MCATGGLHYFAYDGILATNWLPITISNQYKETNRMGAVTDRIEKRVVLRAPRSRVWQAISNAQEFGTWFGAKLEGGFVPGAVTRGHITIPGYEHLTMELAVERIEPEQLFSYRWHPYAIDPEVDYSGEPMTLVEFTLSDADGGTQLTILESGFDQIPEARRAEAFRMNDGGWTAQIESIKQHVS
jgi:uncharacterized protein YndB with AHSA1/START domain